MIHKVNKSKIINKKNPKFKSDRLNDILPYLPNKDLFFDSRHLNYGFTNDILPFSLTARIDNGQQYLKIMDKNTINEKEPIIYDDYNSKIANDQDCIGTITTQTGNSAPRHSYKIIEPKVINPLKGKSDKGWHFEQQVYMSEGITRAIKSSEGSGNIPKVLELNDFEDNEDYIESLPRKEFYGADADTKAHEYLNGLSNKELHEQQEIQDKQDYRIRKLTPRECFRLQGVDDTDIDKIQSAGISNSQQYKLAGNSIVVDVLYHIFRKMFIDKDCESDQLSLF